MFAFAVHILWVFTVASVARVKIQFRSFDIEQGLSSGKCFDDVMVYEGDYRQLGYKPQNLIGMYAKFARIYPLVYE